MRQCCGFPTEDLDVQLQHWIQNTDVPFLKWKVSPIPQVESLPGYNIMAHVKYAINLTLQAYAELIATYVASWRLVLIRQNQADLKNREYLYQAEAELAQKKVQQSLLEAGLEPNRNRLKQIVTALNMAEEN